MTGKLSKNFHGVGIGPLSNILAVKVIITVSVLLFQKIQYDQILDSSQDRKRLQNCCKTLVKAVSDSF